MRLFALAAVAALLPSCVGGALPDSQLEQSTDEELLNEATSATATYSGYLRYDKDYRPRVIAQLARKRNWTPEDTARVLAGNLWVGADQWQVIATRGGRPRHRTQSTFENGVVIEYWHYGTPGYGTLMVTFRDGLCTGWSSSR